MKRTVTKFPIPNILLGIILIAFSVYATFFSEIMIDGIRYIFTLLIVIYSSLRLYKDLNFYKKKASRSIATGEFAISLILAILLAFDGLTLAIVLGLVFYIKGATYLLILQVRKTSASIQRYFFNLALITLGSYILFTGEAYEIVLKYILFVLITLYGLILLYYGVTKLIDDRKKAKLMPHKKNKPSIETVNKPTKATLNPSSYIYTKKALMDKHVDELKQMCKSRNLKGYSTLNKEQLVERLWLYDHQE